ncbi:PERQ amino acid-rich with GYF domain-containing protein [Sarcoptes scabiei]|nr:PERQ amino acid-rich with GYF domain-containing protein [Sarcoptes scabiei]
MFQFNLLFSSFIIFISLAEGIFLKDDHPEVIVHKVGYPLHVIHKVPIKQPHYIPVHVKPDVKIVKVPVPVPVKIPVKIPVEIPYPIKEPYPIEVPHPVKVPVYIHVKAHAVSSY